jgi:hypothetical protein
MGAGRCSDLSVVLFALFNISGTRPMILTIHAP